MRRNEIERVLARSAAALERGEAVALAVVVGVTGSAYRAAGAAMAVGGGWSVGGVSAGCIEGDVRLRARRAIEGGEAETVEYDTGDASPFGLGVGCGGRVRVAIVPLGPDAATRVAADARAAAADGPFDWRVPLGAGLEFRHAFAAPDHLHVHGAGVDSGPLVDLAARAGFRVTVIDHRPALLRSPDLGGAHATIHARPGTDAGVPRRTGRVFVVIKSHHLEHDRAWLRVVRKGDASYIGLMGPAARGVDLIDSTGGPDPRIRAPVGLDLGGEGATAVAISIVAELTAVANGREASPLTAAARGA